MKSKRISHERMYEVIRSPVVTEKSTFISEYNQIVFNVAIDSNKREIKEAIEGNLCRCTGYQQIVTSVAEAGRMLREGKTGEDRTEPASDPHPIGPDEPTLPPGDAR